MISTVAGTAGASGLSDSFSNPWPLLLWLASASDIQETSLSGLNINGTAQLVTGGGRGSGTVTLTLVSGPCTLVGSILKGISAGNCVVRATKAASGSVAAETSPAITVPVAQTLQSPLYLRMGMFIPLGTTTLSTSGGSGTGAVSYTLLSGPCTLSGSTLTATGLGRCVVTATKAADDTYAAATSSLAGGLTGLVSQAPKFNSPKGIAVNNVGSTPSMMYVADTENHAIRVVTLATGAVTTLAGAGVAGWADGTGSSARFNAPSALAISSDNALLFVADTGNGAIRAINLSNSAVTTIVGKSCTSSHTTNTDGQTVYGSCDTSNPDTGVFGTGSFRAPMGMVLSYQSPCSASAGCLLVTDFAARLDTPDSYNVFSVDLSDSSTPVYRLAKIEQNGSTAIGTLGIAQAPNGKIYLSQYYGHQIWSCDPPSALGTLASCAVVAGTGSQWQDSDFEYHGYWQDESTGNPLTASFSNPAELSFDANEQVLYVADSGNAVIRAIDFVSGTPNNVTTIAGFGPSVAQNPGENADGDPLDPVPTVGLVLTDPALCVNYVCGPPNFRGYNGDGAIPPDRYLGVPRGIAYVPSIQKLYLADSGQHLIRVLQQTTTFTFTGPTGGALNTASSNFTITPDGTWSGTVTITPYGGGLSAPTVKTFSASSAAQTFTITPTSVGPITLTATNNGVLFNPGFLTYATPPAAPTIGTAVGGVAQATVPFSAPSANGGAAITGYTVTSSPAGGTDSNAGSTSLSHVVTGLSNDTAYTFTVQASNSVGASAASAASNAVTPRALPTVDLSTANLSITGATLTIAGTGFNPTDASNTVAFNLGAVGTVTAATATQLTVTLTTAPTSAGSLTAVVTSYGGSSGSAVQVATVVIPVDCAVSGWSEFGACSVSCGGGTQTQTRTIITPAAYGGAECPSLSNSQACNVQACSVPQATLVVVPSSTSINVNGTSTLNTSGGSGTGEVSYALVSGPCSLSGATLTGTGAGSCVVTASKAADASYEAATSAEFTVAVTLATQAALAVVPASTTIDVNGTTMLDTSGGSGTGDVSYALVSGPCSLSGATLTGTGAGSCVVSASKAADAAYAAATSPEVTVPVTLGTQATLVLVPANITIDPNGTTTLDTSGGSGTGTVSYTLVSGLCSLSDATLTGTSAGSCVVTATKAADTAYAAATSEEVSVEVIAVHSQQSIKVPFAPLWALVLSAGAISMVAARRR
jgi:sugar lactone lactonase YvrE